MKHRHIAFIGLTGTVLLALGSIATASYRSLPSINPTTHSTTACGLNRTGLPAPQPKPARQIQASAAIPADRLTAQVPVATVCYTFAGPTCPMVIAVPPGSACTCHFPGGILAGLAY